MTTTCWTTDPMEETITITRGQLADALRQLDEQAKAEYWPERTDPDRYAHSADFLFGKLKED